MVLDFAKIGAQAAESEDLTQDKSFERELQREGVALVRLREYIEFGRFESKNPQHKPAQRCMLVFELSHKDHLIEIDGKMVPSTINIRISKGITGKSGYRKLFKVMNAAYDNKFSHFAEMINLAFLADVFHNVGGTPEKPVTYANLDKDGAYSLRKPEQVNALDNTSTPLNIRELDGTPRVFLWENESISDADVIEMWKSIYIEGEREVTDVKTKEVSMQSKNWIQDLIMTNIEWGGSTTEALTQEHVSLDDVDELAGAPESSVVIDIDPAKGTDSTPQLSTLASAAETAPEGEELPTL